MTHGMAPDMTIGDAARRWPALIAVFERFGLDFCCHGRQSLQEACRHAGVSLEAALQAAAETPGPQNEPEKDWSAASMTALGEHIVSTHHAKARNAFVTLATLLPRVRLAHADRHPELVPLEAVVAELRDEMLDHMVREERVLFPWLSRLERPGAVNVGPPWSVKRPIDCMLHDHDSVAAGFRKVRVLTRDYAAPSDACGSYRAMLECLKDLERDTHVHIHKENNILFPAGVRAESRMQSAGARAGTGGCAC